MLAYYFNVYQDGKSNQDRIVTMNGRALGNIVEQEILGVQVHNVVVTDIIFKCIMYYCVGKIRGHVAGM